MCSPLGLTGNPPYFYNCVTRSGNFSDPLRELEKEAWQQICQRFGQIIFLRSGPCCSVESDILLVVAQAQLCPPVFVKAHHIKLDSHILYLAERMYVLFFSECLLHQHVFFIGNIA